MIHLVHGVIIHGPHTEDQETFEALDASSAATL